MRTAYEIYAHRAVASSVGLSDAVIDAIASGDLPHLETDQETSAYEFTWQLVHNHPVDSSTYTAASNALGQRGLVDIVLLVGLYLSVCSIINAFEIPVPVNDHMAATGTGS
jgi:4-carboxymuconolactone decarboxylase